LTGSGDAILTLEATGPEAASLGPASRKRFRVSGGTIGRTPDNDWVLPHALVSAHHAEITFVHGGFVITDTSTNGVFINTLTNRLPKGHPTPINPGELVIIQPYRIQVSIGPPAGIAPLAGTSEALLAGPSYAAPIPAAPIPASPIPAAPIPVGPIPHYDPFERPESGPRVAPQADEVDPLVALGIAGPSQPAPQVPRAEDLGRASALEDHFRPPAVIIPESVVSEAPRGGALIPDDYDPAMRDHDGPSSLAADPFRAEAPRQAPRPGPARPQPRVPEAAAVGGASELAEVLAGAGLPNAAVPPALGRDLGAILKVVVVGVMDLLRARQQIKDEFRMQATRFRAEDNNSLKFSANVGDALHNLLVKRNAAYLGPVDSFEDAFNDLRNHQIAMLFAMRSAFESMLAEFGPERLQSQFDRRVKKKSLLGSGPEAEYWELYRERAEDLARDVEETYRKLFGDRFVEAYEEQLERLNTRSRRGRP
jgi:type VI secretion system FHA domain protein